MLTDEERIARSKRLRSLERSERWKLLAAIVAGLAVLCALLWSVNRHPLPHPGQLIVAECRTDYQRARSAAESLVVDARRPIHDPELDVPANVSCGELRRTDRLAP
jgi:hypothetical protein